MYVIHTSNEQRVLDEVHASSDNRGDMTCEVRDATAGDAENAEELCGQAIETIADDLQEADPKTLVAHVASEDLIAFLLKQVLMASSSANVMNTDEDWVEDTQTWPELKAKISR
ncbi:hypothetical protein OBBRIDRAFT_839077 [Obba rivulosa]|uniref:Uncharacterized protein n=1 Tax=Obba rivulosa TaxID=1052685 RepID=A0A8E2ARB4_9APHY|nr:hypothetical protein OBBRIDRAFT_839077 [Obba rivulosa]